MPLTQTLIGRLGTIKRAVIVRPSCSRLLNVLGFLALLHSSPASAQLCPDLSPYYPGDTPNWPDLAQRLESLTEQCLLSSEFFALLGGAQLNSGLRAEAFESLERALLLNPDNGAAQIDYAQVLFEEGQLFAALELNDMLLEREDLPNQLGSALQERHQQWQSLTRQTNYQAEVLGGYDDNLNGAPTPDQITLTLSGESVLLTLNPDFRPVSGPYLNLGAGLVHRQLFPGHQQNWGLQLRGRASEDSNSDLLQIDGRYSFIRPRRSNSWQLDGSVRNLFFGGSALFTATEARARYSTDSAMRCKPYYDLVFQHQLFHNQSQLNAVDGRASVGFSCPIGTSAAADNSGSQRLNVELGVLESRAIKQNRPGGDRDGWQFTADWEYRLPGRTLRATFNHTRLDDQSSYSPLVLAGGKRQIERSYGLFQYRQPIDIQGNSAALVVNFYHQLQNSNIELFETDDTALEIGLSFSF